MLSLTKARVQALNPAAWKQILSVEQSICIAHEVGYLLPLDEHNDIDPFSVTLMLSDEDRADPRIETCIEEMLEEYVW